MGARLEGLMGHLSAKLAEGDRERSWIESGTHISYSGNFHSGANYSILIPDSKSQGT